jgi:flagellar biogenesis protein FliO
VQAILLTSSLLLVLAMVGSLAWLSMLRVSRQNEAVPAESRDELP